MYSSIVAVPLPTAATQASLFPKPLETTDPMRDAVFTQRKRADLLRNAKSVLDGRIIAADDDSMESAFQSMATTLASLRPGETLLDFVARGPDVIREHVEAIAKATRKADAFDVIELMRLRETPMVLEGYRESLADQRPAAVEVGRIDPARARGTRFAGRRPEGSEPLTSSPRHSRTYGSAA